MATPSSTTPRTTSTSDYEDDESTFWNGMIGFAAFMFLLIGGFHFIGGLVGLLEDEAPPSAARGSRQPAPGLRRRSA